MSGWRNARNDLTAKLVRSRFYYNKKTGDFLWKTTKSAKTKINTVAGHITEAGHVRIVLYRRSYLAHRLIWLWVTGKWPKYELDHRNGKKSDNRWRNLREATALQNNQNKGKRVQNTSGYKGVWFEKHIGLWRSGVGFKGKLYRCGCFKTAKAAHMAYRQLAKRLHKDFVNFG